MSRATTLGELKSTGYLARTVKQEMRRNLLRKLAAREAIFPGIVGYDKTVIPQIQNAILSGHDFILLGLRGQAKTRILRSLVELLDEAIPALAGVETNDDPLCPISVPGRRLVEKLGDDAPLVWIGREERYREKLATPDVTIADLIGDIDPIKAATRKLTYADPEVIHYGIIPRTHRGIFAINELPDLQARIQVGLLNILEEGDIQIRGFPVRLPLDLLMVFSANPEDYTNRGNIITPLRDRISSQIITHYPRTMEESLKISDQEAWTRRDTGAEVSIPEYLRRTIEGVAFEARKSEFVDQKSGVSARLAISLLENVCSNAQRRAALYGEGTSTARMSDLFAALSAITGKIELVYEGEREGVQNVAFRLIGDSAKAVFDGSFPDAYKIEAQETPSAGSELEEGPVNEDYGPVLDFFKRGGTVDVSAELGDDELLSRLREVSGLEALAKKYLQVDGSAELAAGMEFVIDALHQHSLLAKDEVVGGRVYRDMFEDMVRNLRD